MAVNAGRVDLILELRTEEATRKVRELKDDVLHAFKGGFPNIPTKGLIDDLEEAKRKLNEIKGINKAAGGPFGALQGAIGKANTFLQRFGLTTREVGLILGAGFLGGGIAAVIQFLGQMVIAAGKAIFALIKLGDTFQRTFQTFVTTADGAGGEILAFAEKSALAFGITSQQVLKFSNEITRYLESVGIATEDAVGLSDGLVIAADVLRRTAQTGFIPAEEALTAMRDLIGGNIEGLRKLDVRLTESGFKAVAYAHDLELGKETMNDFQRGILSALAAIDQAQERFDDARKGPESLASVFERLTAIFKESGGIIGGTLVPAFRFIAEAAIGFAIGVTLAVKGIKDFIIAIKNFKERNRVFEVALKIIAETLERMVPGLSLAIKLLDLMGKKAKKLGEEALSGAGGLAKLAEDEKKLEDLWNKSPIDDEIKNIQRLRDAHFALQRAVENAADAEFEAKLKLQRAREDAIRKTADALRDLAETEETAEEKIFDARRKRHDVQIQNFRAVRDAEENLSEARKDGAKKVDDAERNLFDARMERFRQLIGAQISLEEALFRGDVFAERSARLALIEARRTEDIEEAKRKLDEATKERAENIRRALRDLDEERFDAHRRLVDANRDLARTIDEQAEAIANARREVHEAEIEINRSLFDANKNLLDTQRKSAQSISDARTNLHDLNIELGTTNLTFADILDKLERMENSLLVSAKNARELTDALPGTYGRRVGSGTSPGGFAEGGFMPGGQIGLVGERGPELIIPNSNSTVVSNEQLIRVFRDIMAGRSGKSNSSSPSFTIVEAIDGQATAAAVINRMVLEGLA